MSSTILEAIKLLNSHTETKITESEDDDLDEEDDWEEEDEYKSLSDYLGYALRSKFDAVDPAKPNMLYITQEPIDSSDFHTILKGIATYYGEAVAGKEYNVTVHCRSYYRGSDFGYFTAKVKFGNNSYEILPGEEIEIYSGDVEISLCKDNSTSKAYYCVECKGEDIIGTGSSLKEAVEEFMERLDYLNDYVEVDDGYEVSRNTLDILDENGNLTTIDGVDFNEFKDAEAAYQEIKTEHPETDTGTIISFGEIFGQIECHTYEEPIIA